MVPYGTCSVTSRTAVTAPNLLVRPRASIAPAPALADSVAPSELGPAPVACGTPTRFKVALSCVARLEPLALSAHFCGEEGTSKYPVATTSAIAYASASEVTVPGDDCFECDSYRRLTIKFTCAHCPRRSAVQDSQQSESSAVCGA